MGGITWGGFNMGEAKLGKLNWKQLNERNETGRFKLRGAKLGMLNGGVWNKEG